MSIKKVVFIVLLLVGFCTFLYVSIYIYKTKAIYTPIKKSTVAFAPLWGTYSYINFDEYPESVKSYLTSEFYGKNFSHEQSLYIRKARMLTSKYSIKTSLKEIKKINKSNGEYVVDLNVKETVQKTGSSLSQDRGMLIYWIKENNEWKVNKVTYK